VETIFGATGLALVCSDSSGNWQPVMEQPAAYQTPQPAYMAAPGNAIPTCGHAQNEAQAWEEALQQPQLPCCKSLQARTSVSECMHLHGQVITINAANAPVNGGSADCTATALLSLL